MTVASLMFEPLLAADCPIEATVVGKPYSSTEEVERYIIQKPENAHLIDVYLLSNEPITYKESFLKHSQFGRFASVGRC